MPLWGYWVVAGMMELLLVLLLFAQTRILSRLKRLNRAVAKIGESGDLGMRIERSGGGEIGELEIAINGMLDDLRRAREREEATNRIYRAIMDHLPIGVSYRDAELNLVAANPRLRDWFPAITKDTAVLHKHAFRSRIIRSAKDPHPCELAVRERSVQSRRVEIPVNGAPRLFDVTVCPIMDSAGTVVNVLEIMADVTEREKLVDRMQRLERLQTVSLMAAGVAHEVNTPLNIMELNASTLEMRLDKDGALPAAAIKKALGAITEQIRRISRIVTHMRELARKEGHCSVVPVSIKDTVTSALSMVEMQAKAHGIVFRKAIPDDLPPIMADAVQFEQTIINLAANAIHALAESARDEKEIRFDASAEADAVRLIVADNGPGLGDATERVFDPFYTTKDPDSGSGLGLSLVRAFVTGWGGDIRAENVPGGGARFIMTLQRRLLA